MSGEPRHRGHLPADILVCKQRHLNPLRTYGMMFNPTAEESNLRVSASPTTGLITPT
jgi:hypothetical protein